jgi:hypothetical protein
MGKRLSIKSKYEGLKLVRFDDSERDILDDKEFEKSGFNSVRIERVLEHLILKFYRTV